jgi:hypothetical protein
MIGQLLSSRLKIFFSAILLTTTLPYIPFLLPFIPENILGFNLTGWAWMIMLVVTLINLIRTSEFEFPILLWLPWFMYIVVYLFIDFSILGLQLTLQYSLPLLIGVVASGFSFRYEELIWIFRQIIYLCILIYLMFIYGYLFRGGFGPAVSSTTMLFTVSVSLLTGLYFMTKDKKFLLYIGILFLTSVLQLTRMGIAATGAVFIFHFANINIRLKIIFGAVGFLALLLVFNSAPFQKKTFYGGHGTISDLTLNYYDNPNIRSTGRLSWRNALKPGLEAAPVWGNGPRADNAFLTKISKTRGGEAHNDYLSVRFNYGYAGLSLLLFGFVTTFISLFRISRKYVQNDLIWLISTSVLTLFISFLMFMYTDNILKYTIYFPNYFFALIGIVYSLKRDEDLSCYPALQ